MMYIKVFCAAIFFAISTCANAIIVDGNFNAWIYSDGSDEGFWSKNLRGSKVTGQFWYDTELAPAGYLYPSHTTSYSSATNSWLHLTYLIDGKTISITESVGSNTNITQTAESVYINASTNFFSIYDEVVERNDLGDFVERVGYFWFTASSDIILHDNLEQSFSWVADGSDLYHNNVELIIYGRSNGQEFAALLSMYLTNVTLAPRSEVIVPAPSSFPLLMMSLLLLVLCRRTSR